LNNTVGYETLVPGKPVFDLNEAFYTDARFRYGVQDMNELLSALVNAIDEG